MMATKNKRVIRTRNRDGQRARLTVSTRNKNAIANHAPRGASAPTGTQVPVRADICKPRSLIRLWRVKQNIQILSRWAGNTEREPSTDQIRKGECSIGIFKSIFRSSGGTHFILV